MINKKIFICSLLTVNLLSDNCDITNKKIYEEYIKAKYKKSSIEKYYNQTICITGKVTDIGKNGLRVVSKNKYEKFGIPFYLQFKNTKKAIILSNIKKDKEIKANCILYKTEDLRAYTLKDCKIRK